MTNEKDFELILAPMAGISDLAFRLICQEFGAKRVYSEMVSVDALFYNSEKTKKLLKSNENEKNLVVQIFGKDPKLFFKASQYISKLKNRPIAIDINFGCPARKVTNNGGGVKLMLNFSLARDIIQATIDGAGEDLAVSIKIRAGIENISAENFLDAIRDLDWRTVMVHGRTYEQGFSGKSNWKMIEKLKNKYLEKEVIPNGSIYSLADFQEFYNSVSFSSVALAQGVLGNPWLFRDILNFINKKNVKSIESEERKKILLKHLDLFLKYKGETAIVEFRKHLAWYVKDLANAKKIRQRLVLVNSKEEILEILKNL